jgi:hypothetical protein
MRRQGVKNTHICSHFSYPVIAFTLAKSSLLYTVAFELINTTVRILVSRPHSLWKDGNDLCLFPVPLFLPFQARKPGQCGALFVPDGIKEKRMVFSCGVVAFEG